MGQKICRGSTNGVIISSRRSQSMRASGNDNRNNTLDSVVVDERLDTSQLPIRLPHISEDLDEDGYDSSNRGASLHSSVTLTRDVQSKNEVAAISKEMREADATPDEVAELDRSNVPISLDERMAITSKINNDNNNEDDDGEDISALDKSNMPIVLDDPPPPSSVKRYQNGISSSNASSGVNSLQYEHENSMLEEQQRRRDSSEKASFLETGELDRSNMPILLDDPPMVGPKKGETTTNETIIDEKTSKSKEEKTHEMNYNCYYDEIVKSTSAGSMEKEERIEDFGFNKDVQLSPKSDSKLVITSSSLNSLKDTNLNATDEASSEQEIKTDVFTQIQHHQKQPPQTQQESTQKLDLVTNKTEKFAIMDLLAADYMRNDKKSNNDKVDLVNNATNKNQGGDLNEPLIQKASSNVSDCSLPLVQTEKFSVHENPAEQNQAS